MSNLRRYYSAGVYYFVTTVTIDSTPILVRNIDLYQKAIKRTCQRFNIGILAWVVLPDHLNLIIDPRTSNLSEIMKVFKQDFGFLYRQRIGTRTGRIWQLRFRDHVIRDQDDMNRHIDYIHYNPVKHGFVRVARAYPYSSFADYAREGFYQLDWGETEEISPEGESENDKD
jgi:putative transposase